MSKEESGWEVVKIRKLQPLLDTAPVKPSGNTSLLGIQSKWRLVRKSATELLRMIPYVKRLF